MSNPHRAIRDTLQRLGVQAEPQQVLETLQRYGVEVSTRLVISVQAEMQREAARAEREQAKRPPAVKGRRRPQQRKIPGR
jgi:post-segregation antitoxin (ccd killing protein)